ARPRGRRGSTDRRSTPHPGHAARSPIGQQTIARRSHRSEIGSISDRPVRRRPGAGTPPSPTPGRPRPSPAGEEVAAMSLFGREPRSVYRVYAEDDYLDGEAERFGA